MNSKHPSFKESYATLEAIAQQLSQTQDVDIDQLVPLVDEATQAYQNCKARLDAVEEALNSRLNQISQ